MPTTMKERDELWLGDIRVQRERAKEAERALLQLRNSTDEDKALLTRRITTLEGLLSDVAACAEQGEEIGSTLLRKVLVELGPRPRKCSWCRVNDIAPAPLVDGFESHGMCPECYAKMSAELDGAEEV